MFNLNEEIKKVISKREASYCLCFETYHKKVQKNLKEIKDKMPKKEVALQAKEIIEKLEKQTLIFRN